MALRLRRGTDAERLLITPVQGELIYTTDTKKLYIGDGTTIGGRIVEGTGISDVLSDTAPQLGGDLDINTFDIVGNGDISINGNISAAQFIGGGFTAGGDIDLNFNNIIGAGNINIDGTINATGNINLGDASSDLITLSGRINSNLVPVVGINAGVGQFDQRWEEGYFVRLNLSAGIIGQDSSIVYNANTGTFTGNFLGDIKGSVVGDDSTLLIDGITSQIVGPINNNQTTSQQLNVLVEGIDRNAITVTTTTGGSNAGNISFYAGRTSVTAPTILQAGDSVIDINSLGWDGTSHVPSAIIKMGADKYTTAIGTGVVPGRIVFLTYNESGTTGLNNGMVFNRFGNLGINTDDPAEKLDVRGNTVVSGFVQFGSLDTTARNALTAANGMVIYNTTDNRFQGVQGGVWINLDDGTAA